MQCYKLREQLREDQVLNFFFFLLMQNRFLETVQERWNYIKDSAALGRNPKVEVQSYDAKDHVRREIVFPGEGLSNFATFS